MFQTDEVSIGSTMYAMPGEGSRVAGVATWVMMSESAGAIMLSTLLLLSCL